MAQGTHARAAIGCAPEDEGSEEESESEEESGSEEESESEGSRVSCPHHD